MNVEKVRQNLSAFMSDTGTTQKQIADESGLSAAVISQFISNTYDGNNTRVSEIIYKYLKLAKERLNVVHMENFYENLRNTQIVLGAARYAHRRCEMILVRGDAGAGKTTALRYYAENNAGVVFVTANSTVKSAVPILNKIALALGRQTNTNKQQLMENLVGFLSNTKRLIIIDEADHLTLSALQAVRNLNDEAHVGIILSGNNKLYMQMVAGARGYEFDQIRTRIFLKPQVINNYTTEEISNIFPCDDSAVLSILNKKANEESLREAIKLYEFALEVAKINNTKLNGKLLTSVMDSIQ